MPPALLCENADSFPGERTNAPAMAPDVIPQTEDTPVTTTAEPAVPVSTASPVATTAEGASAAPVSTVTISVGSAMDASPSLCSVCLEEPEPSFGKQTCIHEHSDCLPSSSEKTPSLSASHASKKRTVHINPTSSTSSVSFSFAQPTSTRSHVTMNPNVFCSKVEKVRERLKKDPNFESNLPHHKTGFSLPPSLCSCFLCGSRIEKFTDLFVYQECFHAYHFTCCLKLSDMNAMCDKCLHPTPNDQIRKQHMMCAAFKNGNADFFKNIKSVKN